MIRCRICGSTLAMNANGKGASCPECGMFYPIDLLRQMLQESRGAGAAQKPGAASAGQTSGNSSYAGWKQDSLEAGGQTKTQSSQNAGVSTRTQGSLEAAVQTKKKSSNYVNRMRNEEYGLPLSEYRYNLWDSVVYPEYNKKPDPPGFFAPAAAKRNYEAAMAEWRRKEAKQEKIRREFDQKVAEIFAYYDRLYELVPDYDLEKDWKPYFENILEEEFPEYTVYKEVDGKQLLGGRTHGTITFLLAKQNRAAMAILLREGERSRRPGIYFACEKAGIPAFVFWTAYSNRREYVIDRIRKKLRF